MLKVEYQETEDDTQMQQKLRVLANPVRFSILRLLHGKRHTAAQLAECLGLPQSSLSEHLSLLRKHELVLYIRYEVPHYYRINCATLSHFAAYLGRFGQTDARWEGRRRSFSNEETQIERARPEHVAAIARIHREAIEDRLATLETRLYTEAEWLARINEREERHPFYLSINSANEVLGWCALNPFKGNPGSQHTAELAIAITREKRGQGLGSELLGEVEWRTLDLNFHKLVATTLGSNAAGVHLFTGHGFQKAGIYREHGIIDGQWADVIIMEKILE